MRRAAIANLGCKVNQAEMDAVARLLRARGVALLDGAEAADLVVVNTCTVTAIADRKSRAAVRRARRNNPDALVMVTGCSATVDPRSLAEADPAARLYDNDSKARLLADLSDLLAPWEVETLPTPAGVDRADESGPVGGWPGSEAEAGSVDDDLGNRADIDRTRAFVKIQDGCSLHCTYCIIPMARGRECSVDGDAVVGEVLAAVAAGHREVVLTGINAGAYDCAGLGLAALVRRILTETTLERIRLSSIEPQHLTDELLGVWADSAGRCLPHFHIPLQSGDDQILRRMGRRYSTAGYAALVRRVRATIPGAAVHADVIVGFPGEDDASWDRTRAFLGSLDLAGLHIFRYSARPGTAAVRMVGQVDSRTRKRRAAEALALGASARARFAARQLGTEMRVLFERPLPDGRWLGHAENHVLVAAAAPDGVALANAIGLVRGEAIDHSAPDRVAGRLLGVDWDPIQPAGRADGAAALAVAHEPLAGSASK